MIDIKATGIKFSPQEETIVRMLERAGKPLTTLKIVEKLYRNVNGDKRPDNARQNVTNVVRALVKKTSRKNSPIRVRRSKRSGPNPIDVWLEMS